MGYWELGIEIDESCIGIPLFDFLLFTQTLKHSVTQALFNCHYTLVPRPYKKLTGCRGTFPLVPGMSAT